MSAGPDLPLWRAAEAPSEPAFLLNPETDLDRRFAAFHRAHPELYAEIARRALDQAENDVRRISIADICEDIRKDPAVDRGSGAFKVNNSYRAYYSRLLLFHHASLRGRIETRQQKEKVAA